MTEKRWNHHSFAHKMVAHTQAEIANEIYEIRATTSNKFYKQWPDRLEFVRIIAPSLREAARQALSEMLARHDVSEHDKEEIYEALLLDATVPNEDRFPVEMAALPPLLN